MAGAFEKRLSKKGVTRVQWIALYYLGLNNNISQKELADRMHIKESTVARLIDRMEREELVERRQSEDDRRVINLVLTDKGYEYRKKLLPEGERFNDIVSQNITEEEMKLFCLILEKMVNNIKRCMLD
ncbi:MarR family winged helix-turn-helix transcriptional regulator [Brassicibacter mesophilus]|uniref:MarR family winged helix-turn-helix transcriptional regulator n=1 Tax=Brassicibacter mesophilus TaxID=745119 RepID=UPI003D22B46E